MLPQQDIYLFAEGTHARLFDVLGCHCREADAGANFAVWAPNAQRVSAIGDWNGWDDTRDRLSPRPDASGIWEVEAAGARRGDAYKFRISANEAQYIVDKADPFAWSAETPPATASRVWSLENTWHDQGWMRERAARNALDQPWSIYEVHLG